MSTRANEIDAALAMIDTRQWRSAAAKLRVLLVVKLNTVSNARAGDGVPLGRRYIAQALGLGTSRVGVILRDLVDERVLIEIAPGAGRRAAVYAIQPEVRAWRVPWAVAVELVETRIELISGRLVSAKPGVARAAWGSPQPIVARAAWGGPQDGAFARAQGVSTTGTVARAAWGSPQPLDPRATSPLPSNSASSSEREADARKVMAAITARTCRPVYGSLVARIEALVQNQDVDELVRLVVGHPNANAGPPAIVADLEMAIAGGGLGPARAPAWIAEPECELCEGTGHVLAGRDAPPGPCPCRRSPKAPSVGESTP